MNVTLVLTASLSVEPGLFHRVRAEHTFQTLTESTKPGTAHRTGSSGRERFLSRLEPRAPPRFEVDHFPQKSARAPARTLTSTVMRGTTVGGG